MIRVRDLRYSDKYIFSFFKVKRKFSLIDLRKTGRPPANLQDFFYHFSRSFTFSCFRQLLLLDSSLFQAFR